MNPGVDFGYWIVMIKCFKLESYPTEMYLKRSKTVRKLVAFAVSAAWLSSASPLSAASLGEQFGNGAAHVGLHGGTLGLGVNAGYDFSNDLAIRGLVNYFNLDFEKEKAGNEYDGELDLRSVGLVLDWHPFWGAFRLSGGAFLNNNQVSASAESVRAGLDIGGVNIPRRQAQLPHGFREDRALPGNRLDERARPGRARVHRRHRRSHS